MADNEILQMHDLKPAPGAKKDRTRVGRGEGAKGKTTGRGAKGQTKRNHVRPGFEGGQMPLQRRLPKRGFKNYLFKVEYEVINIARLVAAFEGKSEISLDDIYDRGLCPFGAPVKILGEGELSAAIKVEAHKFSQSAADKIRAAGGEVKELEVEG